ncbi:nicotinamide-nucleotide amidohydrolase family protein [Corynebacterium variabile]|uniref:nicotinamide-nucleotide amidohydrolase family protein n=1 Tax=Corynebacterium variabile TaxID=1727 RepID=UPI002898555D|nr:nicotinamide-nucleotide amidohydrolase family protein [Corynebacterium variabile]
MSTVEEAGRHGHEILPAPQEKAMRSSLWLQSANIVFLTVSATMNILVAGQSQAMRASWAEDILSMAAPLSFLVGAYFLRKPPTRKNPYGRHRSLSISHLVSATALFAVGAFLAGDALLGLAKQEHPPIGLFVLFGHEMWAGWPMIVVSVVLAPFSVFFGHRKMALARILHDKVLYSSAKMNKADWSSAVATVAGVAGVGLGMWWADGAAATVVGASIVLDGVRNLRVAVRDITDARVTDLDGAEDPLIRQVEETARGTDWAGDAVARIRDESHVYHTEVFVTAREGQRPTARDLEGLRDEIRELNWVLYDTVVVLSSRLPDYLVEDGSGEAPHDDHSPAQDDGDGIAERVGELARRNGWSVAVAESATGGRISSRLAAVPECSDWFLGGVVSYRTAVKQDVLGVQPGPVISREAVTAMVDGVCRLTGAEVAVAVSGSAGPHEQEGQPAGTVWLAVSVGHRVRSEKQHFDGEPEEVLVATEKRALEFLVEEMEREQRQ